MESGDLLERADANLRRLGYFKDRDFGESAFRAAVKEFKGVYAKAYGWAVDEDVEETLPVLVSPQCGNADRVGRGPLASSSNEFPIKVFLKQPPTADLGPHGGNPFTEVLSAIDTWNGEGSKYSLTLFEEVGVETEARCVIAWKSKNLDFGEDVIARADYPDSGKSPLMVIFDDRKPWVVGSGTGFDIEAVALHELGHILGLSHDEVDSDAVMNFVLDDGRRFLSFSDQLALRDLLGAQRIEPHGLLRRAAFVAMDGLVRVRGIAQASGAFVRRAVATRLAP
jgi:hypothetical protein